MKHHPGLEKELLPKPASHVWRLILGWRIPTVSIWATSTLLFRWLEKYQFPHLFLLNHSLTIAMCYWNHNNALLWYALGGWRQHIPQMVAFHSDESHGIESVKNHLKQTPEDSWKLPCDFEDSVVLNSSSFTNGKYIIPGDPNRSPNITRVETTHPNGEVFFSEQKIDSNSPVLLPPKNWTPLPPQNSVDASPAFLSSKQWPRASGHLQVWKMLGTADVPFFRTHTSEKQKHDWLENPNHEWRCISSSKLGVFPASHVSSRGCRMWFSQQPTNHTILNISSCSLRVCGSANVDVSRFFGALKS